MPRPPRDVMPATAPAPAARLAAGIVAAGLHRPVAATAEVPLELLRDGIAGRLRGVPGVAGALELADVLRHLLVVGRGGVDRRLPRDGLGRQISAGDLRA